MVQPCSNAIAACWASATSFPVAPASRHSLSKMSRWSGPGPTMRAVGRSTSEDTNANDWSRVDGGSKILGLVTTRTKPDRTRTERANGSGPVAKRVTQVAYSACSGMESSTCAYIRTFTSGSSISNQGLPCPKRASSSCASRALVRSRSTPGRGCTPRTVTNWNGGGSDASRRFRASSNVLAIKALTLMPRASAARRTCFASWSSREIVVLMIHYHNIASSVHQWCQTHGIPDMCWSWDNKVREGDCRVYREVYTRGTTKSISGWGAVSPVRVELAAQIWAVKGQADV